MEIIIANHSCFCFGVERAIDIVLETSKNNENVATFGPIIHNPQVVEDLKEKGVDVIKNIDDVSNEKNIIIRSHGVEKNVKKILEEKSLKVTDATCPFVLKAQEQVQILSKECDAIVILGEIDHPEVKGIVSYAEKEVFVISDENDAKNLPFRKKYGFLAQTTQNNKIFLKISDIIKDKCENIVIKNTICNATEKRQEATIDLAKKVEVMVVVGGKNSANTTRLYHLSKEICKNTYHIETPAELDKSIFNGVNRVGITAGASTPKEFVYKVREYIYEVIR